VESLKGHLLVAARGLADPNFARAVILMLGHGPEGAAGLVLNRPTDETIAKVAEQAFGEEIVWDKAIHLGGPVPGPLVVLHAAESLADEEVFEGVYSTADSDKLRLIVRQRVEPSLVVSGYAGWGPGQLEDECAEDTWRSLPARAEHVFWAGDDDLWDAVIAEIGRADLAALLKIRTMPDDPAVN
jgi:putative transcriptional regulator